jgi:eukaryotic-like serine/threonine-protein kinase
MTCEPVNDPRLGTLLNGKYRIERVLGAGGMATVYGASHRNGRSVAIKMLHPRVASDPDVRSRFLKEGYVANAVGHAGVVTVLDDDVTDDGAVFIVMELLEGFTLAELAGPDGRAPLDAMLVAAHELLDVLAAAHEKKITHRDIKPDNVFITHDGRLKVLDFGIARTRSAEKVSMATRDGLLIGTPGFMPPEQALGRNDEVDGKTDLWAVGATLYTLLAGREVHDAQTPEELLIKTAIQPVPSLALVAHQMPRAIVDVVDRALEMDRSRRWDDARAMQSAIATAYTTVFGRPFDRRLLESVRHRDRRAAPVQLAATQLASPSTDASFSMAASSGTTSKGKKKSRKRYVFVAGLIAAGVLAVAVVRHPHGFALARSSSSPTTIAATPPAIQMATSISVASADAPAPPAVPVPAARASSTATATAPKGRRPPSPVRNVPLRTPSNAPSASAVREGEPRAPQPPSDPFDRP